MAFAAQREELPPPLWLLFTASALWTVIYDTKYAMVDREDDLVVWIKSSAILFGNGDRLMIGLMHGMAGSAALILLTKLHDWYLARK